MYFFYLFLSFSGKKIFYSSLKFYRILLQTPFCNGFTLSSEYDTKLWICIFKLTNASQIQLFTNKSQNIYTEICKCLCGEKRFSSNQYSNPRPLAYSAKCCTSWATSVTWYGNCNIPSVLMWDIANSCQRAVADWWKLSRTRYWFSQEDCKGALSKTISRCPWKNCATLTWI